MNIYFTHLGYTVKPFFFHAGWRYWRFGKIVIQLVRGQDK